MMASYNPTAPVKIEVAGLDLEFHPIQIDDPIPTGRQIAKAAGCKPPDEAVVMHVRSDGELDLIRPDEVVDLRNGSGRFTSTASALSGRGASSMVSSSAAWPAFRRTGRSILSARISRIARLNPPP